MENPSCRQVSGAPHLLLPGEHPRPWRASPGDDPGRGLPQCGALASPTTAARLLPVPAFVWSYHVRRRTPAISCVKGMNNAMKTSLGKALAEALRYYYFDSDSLVEEAAGGQSAARAFREADESGFRDSETEVLKQLSSMGRLVVCAGDGAVQSVTNLSYLRYGISVWVDIPLDIVADEVSKKGVELPNAQGISMPDPFAEVLTGLAKRYKEMKGGYSTADATVSLLKVASKLGYDDLNTVTPEDMALEVLIEIEKLTRVKKMMEDAARPF